jgi:hypothetical protein
MAMVPEIGGSLEQALMNAKSRKSSAMVDFSCMMLLNLFG